MAKIRQPTTTSLVLEALVAADDLMTIPMLQDATGRRNLGDVRSALYGLLHYHAVDFVISGEVTWWFATPSTDTRMRVMREIAADIKRGPRPKDYKRKGKKQA
jgi:hypothetical protein